MMARMRVHLVSLVSDCTLAAITLAAITLTAAPVRATALGREVGAGQVRLLSTTLVGLWAYDDDGQRADADPLRAQSFSTDLELGVAPRLTLRAKLPWVISSTADASGVQQRSGIGDVTIGGQLRLTETGPVALSARLDVKAPFYSGPPTVRGRSPSGGPALGDGQVDVTALALLGGRLPFSGFVDLELGYRLRAGDVTDAVVGGGRLGVRALERRLLLALRLDTVVTFDPAAGSAERLGRGGATLGPWVALRVVDALHLEMGAYYVGRGRNAPGGAELTFGLWLPF